MKRIIKISLVISLLLCAMLSFTAVYAEEQKTDWISIVWGNNYYQEKDLPDGLKGYSYPVPECVAVDNHGNQVGGVQVFAYDSSDRLVPIIDGRISTAQSGQYQIVYEIEHLTFSATKTVIINVLEENSISYDIHEDIESNYYTGQTILLHEGEKTGGLGALTLDCQITVNGQPYEVCDFGGVKYFTPKQAGVYSVNFTLTDYVGQSDSKVMDIIVTDCPAPIISQPSIQKINRVGETINLPIIDAVLYVGENSYLVPVKVYVDDVDVSLSMEYVATLGDHVIKYVATNFDGTKSTEYSYSVKVLDDEDFEKYTENYHYINNYFYLEDLNTEYKNGTCYLVNDGSTSSAKMEFATKISAKQLNVDFAVDKARSNFETINYRLVDSRDLDKSILITMQKNVDKVNISVNGKACSSIEYSFTNSTGLSSINLDIDDLTGEIRINGNVVSVVSAYENGSKFTGFDSLYCYASIELLGITGQSAINLISIAGMNVTDIDYEISSPKYDNNDGFNDVISAEINQEVVLPYVEFFDPLDKNVTVKLKVSDPDGKVVINQTITEDVKLVVTKYGSYSVEYMATDRSNNYEFRYALISVVDREFPTIKVDAFKGFCRVGDTIQLPEPTINDNTGIKDLVAFVYIVTENSQRVTIRDYKYTFLKAGDYLITYVVMDEAGNYSAIEFNVKCR